MRTRLVIVGFLAVVLLTTLVLIPVYRSPTDRAPPIILFVLLAAAIGRGVDLASQALATPALMTTRSQYLDLGWNLLASMVFAVVIYLMFQGGIIEGALFPRFDANEVGYDDMLDYMNAVKPKTNSDTAKVLFWSFITGYSAKFVPNLLISVTSKSATAVAVTDQDERG